MISIYTGSKMLARNSCESYRR